MCAAEHSNNNNNSSSESENLLKKDHRFIWDLLTQEGRKFPFQSE